MAAIALDMLAGLIGARAQGWHLHAGHFSERHGLIVIIALGESLIVAASAVSGKPRSVELLIAGGLAVVVTCLLWWSYFAWVREFIEEKFSETPQLEQARFARDAYSFVHFPLVCGIIGIAIGFERILGQPHAVLPIPVALALGGGVFLFVGSTALSVWRASGALLFPRFLILAVTLLLVGLSVGRSPGHALAAIAVGLFLIVIAERSPAGSHL